MIIISGLPRSGTSMMMKIMEAGGLKVVTDGRKKPTNANPNGFYEFGGMEYHPEWWVEKAEGDCIKVLVPQVNKLKGSKDKFIFMHRDLTEIADSFNTMHRADTWAMSHLRGAALDWMKDKDVVHLNYNLLMENPAAELGKIKDLLPDFNKALSVVDKKLYRIRRKVPGQKITHAELKNKKELLERELDSINILLKEFEKLEVTLRK